MHVLYEGKKRWLENKVIIINACIFCMKIYFWWYEICLKDVPKFYIMKLYFQEFFAKKTDASLFMFGSHNKKRPNNLVLGELLLMIYWSLFIVRLNISVYYTTKYFSN